MKSRIVAMLLLTVLMMNFEWLEAQESDLKADFAWFEGVWQTKGLSDIEIEQWKWRAGRWEGHGTMISSGDTVFSERMFIDRFAEITALIPIVNGRAVMFSGIKYDHAWHFENREHDYPQLIVYELIDSRTLRIKITGAGPPREYDLYKQD